MEKDAVEKKDTILIWVTIIAIVVILGLWLLTYFCLKDLSEAARSSYGEMFGGINSLFSGLALAGIILTILLQRNELALQRQELKETREELKRTANAQEKSEIALNRQAENLEISAKLTALNTLVNYYGGQEKQLKDINSPSPTLHDFRIKKEDCIKRIKEIIEHNE